MNTSTDSIIGSIGSIDDSNIIIGYIIEFLKENKIWIIVTIMVTLICNPIEMIVLSDLFTNFTTAINNLEYAKSISVLWKMTAVYIFIDLAYMLGNYFDKIYYPKLEKFIRFKLIDIIFNHNEEYYDKEDEVMEGVTIEGLLDNIY